MKINPVQCAKALQSITTAGLVPFLTAAPGVGKSDITKKMAKDLNLKVIDFRLSQSDPSDMMGFPTLNEDRSRSHYAPPSTFPLSTDPLPKDEDGKEMDGWLLFFDEFNSAPVSVQAAAYKIVLDREIGEHQLHEKVRIVAAGNRTEDKAIVTKLSTAMQSRLVHLDLEVTHKEWVEWALTHNVDERVISYLEFAPSNLHRFDPQHNDKTFPCPRTWEFLSRIITGVKDIGADETPLITGTIGEGVGLEFRSFLKVYKYLPTLEEMLANPIGVKIPDEPNSIYALSGMISHAADSKNLDKLYDVLTRLPKEFQVVTTRNMIKKSPELMVHPSMQKWMSEAANRSQF